MDGDVMEAREERGEKNGFLILVLHRVYLLFGTCDWEFCGSSASLICIYIVRVKDF